jgi:hypothetical protein
MSLAMDYPDTMEPGNRLRSLAPLLYPDNFNGQILLNTGVGARRDIRESCSTLRIPTDATAVGRLLSPVLKGFRRARSPDFQDPGRKRQDLLKIRDVLPINPSRRAPGESW